MKEKERHSVPNGNIRRTRRGGITAVYGANDAVRRPLSQTIEFRKDLYERFQVFSIVQSFKNIKQMFKDLYGRHSPIKYKSAYNFQEQWEASRRENSSESEKGSLLYAIYAILMVLAIALSIWGLSMEIVFEFRTFGRSLFSIIFLVNALEIGKYCLFECEVKSRIIPIIRVNLSEIYCIIYSIGFLASNWYGAMNFEEVIPTLVAMYLLYKKLSKKYQELKIFHISSDSRDYINLFDLFVLLITVSHIFAIGLFRIATIDPTHSWLTKIDGLINADWVTQYIYSIYFASTTLLTVGYGDISPTNSKQILAILVIQLIGIATFAYAVNQIGVALSSMQAKNQKMEKDLNTVENIGNIYKLDPEVVCRMRTELINNKATASGLNVQEENRILLSFSDELRQNIQIESSMKVIKRSMFMIAHWTGRLQSKVATRLVKELYSTEEPLSMIPGKEKFYIVDQGRIQISNDARVGYKICFQKVLKIISVKKNQEIVLQNVYGYSTILSGKKIQLKAVCKQTSICYTLKKSDFFEILAECEQDLQHFHELKNKIDLAQIPEQVEAPAIVNIRQHYHPSVHYTVASEKFRLNCLKNKRINYQRNFRRQPVVYSKNMQKSSYRSNSADQNAEYFVSLNTLTHEPIQQSQLDESERTEPFEALKQFTRYFKKYNCETIVKRFASRNHHKIKGRK